MSSNFSIIQQPNNTYILKYDMGTTCYQGFIDQNIFPEELRVNYIEVVHEAIKYFLKESEKETKIVSMLQHPNTFAINYFMISFQRNDQFVKYQRYVSIELNKIIKTVNDYLFEFDQRIVCNKNTIHDLVQKNEKQEVEIKNLKEIIDKLVERIIKLEERPVIQQQTYQPPLFNTGLTMANTVHSTANVVQPTVHPTANAVQPSLFSLPQPQINLPTNGNQEKKDIPLFFQANNQNGLPPFDSKNCNIQTSVKKKDLALTPSLQSFLPPKIEEHKDKTENTSFFSI
jgi:hypothetical protein